LGKPKELPLLRGGRLEVVIVVGGRLKGVIIRMDGGKLEVVVVDLKLLA
jgi:hypothetical protein